MTIFYPSGPMRGYAKTNFPAFDEVKRYAESCADEDGTPWVCLSPADNDRAVWPGIEEAPGFAEGTHLLDPPLGFTFPELFIWDVWAIGQADYVVMLPGWEDSVGAQLEKHVGEAFGKQIVFAVFEGDKCVYIQPADPNEYKRRGASLEEDSV